MNIPNFVDVPIVDKSGKLTDEWRNIFMALFQTLNLNASNEGLVAPTQPRQGGPANAIALIQNNTNQDGSYTCQFGTILYDSVNNSIRIAINNGAGAPIFKTVTLT